jgi:Domain of unknown function (DUF3846)
MKIYRTDGRIDTMDLAGRKVTLEELQDAVGGYIEAVPGTRSRAYCNEEGLLKKLPFNMEASLRFSQKLVGDVVELEPGDKQ